MNKPTLTSSTSRDFLDNVALEIAHPFLAKFAAHIFLTVDDVADMCSSHGSENPKLEANSALNYLENLGYVQRVHEDKLYAITARGADYMDRCCGDESYCCGHLLKTCHSPSISSTIFSRYKRNHKTVGCDEEEKAWHVAIDAYCCETIVETGMRCLLAAFRAAK